MSHTILLIQPTRKLEARSYGDFESLNEALNDIDQADDGSATDDLVSEDSGESSDEEIGQNDEEGVDDREKEEPEKCATKQTLISSFFKKK